MSVQRFLITAICLVFIFTFTKQVHAATYIVDRADDIAGATACTAAANDCSLRGAIINANANGAGADIIQFNVNGGNAQTITMSSTPLPTIQTSLTIDGTTQPLFGGLPLVEINGAASVAGTQGFYIQSPVGGTPITVTIKSLIINRFQGNGIYFNASSGITATVVGCYIGANPGGSIDLGNGNNGIRIDAYPNSTFTIGGTATSERNIISGNEGDGIRVVSALGFQNANTQVTVLNNFIGTTAGGNIDLGNTGSGIDFGGPGFGYSLQVGNGLGNGRNIIGGNDLIGISATSGAVTIVGNYIGASFNGNGDVGNTLDGIQLAGDVVSATIGGTVLGIPVGNVISGNNRMGIWINDASIPATIRGNKIGTNAAGTAALGNNSNGIFLYENDTFTNSNITIGSETEPLDGNTISGNGADGIEISEKVRGVKVFGNRIGTNDTATAKIANTLAGIRILSANNEIGKSGNNTASNIISGNNQFGIMLVGAEANQNIVYNNFIGTNAAGANLGNAADGIYINQNASNNLIGSSLSGGTNQIAFNGGNGVNVADGQNTRIRKNSIYSNGGLGIDLNGDGVTLNDLNDNDSGPNNLQNFPVIQNSTTTRVTGFLNSKPNTVYEIDFYRVDSCDASGFGEGREFLGTFSSFSNNNGNMNFSVNFASLTAGQIITATATDPDPFHNTSEFSQCSTVTPPNGDLTFSAAAYSTNEAAGQRTIVVNRTGGSFGAIQVDYATSNGTATAGQDYTATSGTLFFADGEVVKSFNIPILEDTLDENDETVNITLSNPSIGVLLTPNPTAILTIQDNDNPPTIAIEDVSMNEGNLGTNQFSFRVSLSAPSGKSVSVDYITQQGTATASSDYATIGGTVNFAPGETVKNILVTIIGDLTPELDETFFVNLSNPTNASFGDNQGLGTILDDDNPGKFSFAFAPYSGTEHDTVTITVARTNGTAGTVSVDYATSGGTASPGTDYTPVAGTLIFGDGETTKTFNVSLADDLMPEPTETVNLVLSNPIGGATLGVPSIAVLTIFDNDNGALLNLAGEVRKADNTPVQNVTMTLQGAQNATTTTDANGRYAFANLAPNSNYTVTPSAIGYTFNPISQQLNNLVNDNLSVNFTATAAPSRQLRIIGGDTTPTQNVNVVVELVAQGDENSVGFSLNYDSTILSNPNVVLNPDASTAFLTVNNSQSGKVGILLALAAGQPFTVGTKSLVTITFNTAATNAFSSPVTFGNVPITKQVVNTNADPLPTNYLDGAVTFAQGYESDVAPRPTGTGNGSVTVADFTQVGRFVAGLDTPNQMNEFQRADSAPRISLGNGVMSVSDYTQAGRYAAGLDVVNPSGGPTSQSFASLEFDGNKLIGKDFAQSNMLPRILRVVNATAFPGLQVVVSIEIDSDGNENGFGFSLNYDSTKLSNPFVQKGIDSQTATLLSNTNQSGKVGVVLALPAGQTMQSGTRQIVAIRFDVAANASSGLTPLTFNDMPVFREVVDENADTLTTTFQDGSINISAPTSANVNVSGRVTMSNGNGVYRAVVSITDSNGFVHTVLTNPFGYYRFTEIPAGETYIINVNHKRYQFNPSLQILTIIEDMENINFTAQE